MSSARHVTFYTARHVTCQATLDYRKPGTCANLRHVTFGEDTRRRLAGAKTLPEAIGILKDAAGSDDKLAADLGTSRKTVISWRKHGVWPETYLGVLRDRGVPDALLQRATPEEIERRLRAAEAEILAIRDLLP